MTTVNKFCTDWPDGTKFLPPDLESQVEEFFKEIPPFEGDYFILLGTLIRRGVPMEMVLPLAAFRLTATMSIYSLRAGLASVGGGCMEAIRTLRFKDATTHAAAAIQLVTARDGLESLYCLVRLLVTTFPGIAYSPEVREAEAEIDGAVTEVDALVDRNDLHMKIARMEGVFTTGKLSVGFRKQGDRSSQEGWWHAAVFRSKHRALLNAVADEEGVRT